MVDAITPVFQRLQERYAEGELVLMIDGSGGMPHAFQGEGNPFVVAVEYGVDAKALSTNCVSALVFGENGDRLPPPLPLDGQQEPMRYFTGGPSFFMPTFDAFAKAYDGGTIKSPAHLVIISDGEISESMGSEHTAVVEKITHFLRTHPEAMIDVIIPGHAEFGLTKMMKEIAQAIPENPPRVFMVDDVSNLRKSIAEVINERSGTTHAQMAMNATEGVEKQISLMPTLRFRKPENI